MSGVLTKPKTQAYRSFLYLNGDEVINSLSALQGGDIDEILTRTAEEGGGEVGAELNVGAAKGKGGRKRSRRSEEEIRRKRTEPSATALLLRKLHARVSGFLGADCGWVVAGVVGAGGRRLAG